MSPYVHIVLIHGADLVEENIIPIGQLSEDAQESRHKDARNFRRDFARKSCRKFTNKDLMSRLFLTSDPLRSSKLFKYREKQEMREEVKQLLDFSSE